MVNRIWDPQGKYKAAFLREYDHWVLEVSFRQHTLGCFIIFAKRSVEKISKLHSEEVQELPKVMEDIESALLSSDTFKPNRFNYLQMGNALHHLHFHGIPRYEAERNFNQAVWKDETFGHPPVWSKTEASEDLVAELRDEISRLLSNSS